MTQQLAGKVAVITGGTSGIGAATAELFVQEGAQVIFTGRSKEKGEALAQLLGDNAVYFEGDVTVEADIEGAIQAAVDRFGGLNVLFNNAGGPTPGDLASITPEQVQYGVNLLLSSAMLGTKHAVEPLKAAGGGAIINNSSVAAIRYNQGNILYSAIKAALTHYTKLAGVELGQHGIRVNAISPGAIATPIFWGGSARANQLSDADNTRKFEKLKSNLAKANPMGVTGLAEDIAQAALYLASDAGRFVNSMDLVVDGGRTSLFRE